MILLLHSRISPLSSSISAKQNTLDSCERWLRELREFSNESVSVMLVGNKLDLRHFRAVPTEVALKFAEKNHLAFIGSFFLSFICIR